MKIITTPMCEDVLKIAGLNDYKVVKPTDIKDADFAILLSETKSEIPKISIKLNTYTQLYESILKIEKKFNTTADKESLKKIEKLIDENYQKKVKRRKINVKVYSNFLNDTIEDMGYNICNVNYDYIVIPDYMNIEIENKEQVILVPSHKNVSKDVIQRITNRYELLEKELCMKQ